MRGHFFLYAFILLLSACGGRPHPVGYYDLVKVEDSLRSNNTELLARINLHTRHAEEVIDSFPSDTLSRYRKLIAVKKATLDMHRYLAGLKLEIFQRVDANISDQSTMMELKDMRNPGNTDITTRYFIGDDPGNVTGRSKEIKQKLAQFREMLGTYTKAGLGVEIEHGLSVNDVTTSWDGKEKSWEEAKFYQANAAEAYVELTRLQETVLKAGALVIDRLNE